MTQRYRHHAEHIVQRFQQALDEATSSAIPTETWEMLSMQIESAISTAALTELEATADQIADLAAGIRRQAETFDTRATL